MKIQYILKITEQFGVSRFMKNEFLNFVGNGKLSEHGKGKISVSFFNLPITINDFNLQNLRMV